MQSIYNDIRYDDPLHHYLASPVCAACGKDNAGQAIHQTLADMIANSSWVRAHAQDYILEYFRLLTDRRKQAHQLHIDRIMDHAFRYYNAPAHPQEIQAAQAALKRGIDEDWQNSVQRYPEVLQYFYSLGALATLHPLFIARRTDEYEVEFNLPSDDDPTVRDPPLSALNGSRQPKRGRPIGAGGAATVASGPSMHLDRELPGRRSPPLGPIPPRGADRRTPGPPAGERRHSFARAPPQPSGGYYGPPPSAYHY